MEPLQKDWLDYIVGISQIVVAIATVAAGLFAGEALKETRRDRVEREKPFLAAKTGEYEEAPEPEPKSDKYSYRALSTNPANKAEPILINAGNGPALDLSITLNFELQDEAEKLQAQKYTCSYMGGGLLRAGEHLPTHEIVDMINVAFLSNLRDDLKKSTNSDSTYDFRLKIQIEATYRDKGQNYYSQIINLTALVETYPLLASVPKPGTPPADNSLESLMQSSAVIVLKVRRLSFRNVLPK